MQDKSKDVYFIPSPPNHHILGISPKNSWSSGAFVTRLISKSWDEEFYERKEEEDEPQ